MVADRLNEGGQFWTPILPATGSILHAGSHANCQTGEFTDVYGGRFRADGRTSSRSDPYRLIDLRTNAEVTIQFDYASRATVIEKLCPAAIKKFVVENGCLGFGAERFGCAPVEATTEPLGEYDPDDEGNDAAIEAGTDPTIARIEKLLAERPDAPLLDPEFSYVRRLEAEVEAAPAELFSRSLIEALKAEAMRIRNSPSDSIDGRIRFMELDGAIVDKSREFEAVEFRASAQESYAGLVGRGQKAEREFGSAVDQIGYPSEFLSAAIRRSASDSSASGVLTFRQWLSLVHSTGRYELIEGRYLDTYDAYGVLLKVAGRRPVELYFTLSGSDLFVEFWGEGSGVRRVMAHERITATMLITAAIQ